ncbi:protein split ends isoform X2 [Culex pipiens pallens]|uniref:protein split ends isoform X2 n=1 Tax=Culex pipiens pallens TaxID=42434 RepID=UPI001953A39C|nr:protein split ends isoform X2 [Culex pipiens pallens]
MVRETRHLWVGNLPETVREDRIREHFKRYGRVQSVRLITSPAYNPASSPYTGSVSSSAGGGSGGCSSGESVHNGSPGGGDFDSGLAPPRAAGSVVVLGSSAAAGSATHGTTTDFSNSNNSNSLGSHKHIPSSAASAGSVSSNCSSSSVSSDGNGLVISICATIAFMDIKSASKAHTAEHKFDDRILTTEYYEPSLLLNMPPAVAPSTAPQTTNAPPTVNCSTTTPSGDSNNGSAMQKYAGNTAAGSLGSNSNLQYSSSVTAAAAAASNAISNNCINGGSVVVCKSDSLSHPCSSSSSTSGKLLGFSDDQPQLQQQHNSSLYECSNNGNSGTGVSSSIRTANFTRLQGDLDAGQCNTGPGNINGRRMSVIDGGLLNRGRPRDRQHYRNGPYAAPPTTANPTTTTLLPERSNPINHHRLSSTGSWYNGNNSSSGSNSGDNASISGPAVAAAPATGPVTPTGSNPPPPPPSSAATLGASVINVNNNNSYDSFLVKSQNHVVVGGHFAASHNRSRSRSRSHSPSSSCSSTNSTTTSQSNETSSTTRSPANVLLLGGGGNSREARSDRLDQQQQGAVRGSLHSAVASVSSTNNGGNSSGASSSSGSGGGNLNCHSDDNRPLAICVRNLPARSSDTSLKDGLFHEYKKHGKVTWVKVVGQSTDRYALVCFKKPEDVEKALEVSHDKLFFGCKIEVAPYQGYDVDDNEFRPYEAELDEYHPKSTRTLFIGNLEKDITAGELRKHFDCFGEIIEIDIKKQGVSAYAFCQYSDIVSVVKAMRKMDGEHLGSNRIKLGFGKSMPTNCVWIDGIADNFGEGYLKSQFDHFGAVSQVTIDRERKLALVFFEQVQCAQAAVKEMRGTTLRGRKLQVDFASRECQEAFFDKLDKQLSVSFGSPRFEAGTGSRYANNRYVDNPGRSRATSFSRPGNPLSLSGAVSPRHDPSPVASSRGGAGGNSSSRSRIVRYSSEDYYLDGGGGSGGGGPNSHGNSERRFRSYDEYSQGSAASSHEDVYDHESYGGASGTHPRSSAHDRPQPTSTSDSPPPSVTSSSGLSSSIQSRLGDVDPSVALSRKRSEKSPGDIRYLQKERVHILEQLEECPSSGDELVSPKKRIKYNSDAHHGSCDPSDHHHPHYSSSAVVASASEAVSSGDPAALSGTNNSSGGGGHHHYSGSNNSSNHYNSHHHHHHHNNSESGVQSSGHRKCVEVRRLSDCNLQQSKSLSSQSTPSSMHSNNNSRRPSTDSTSLHQRHGSSSSNSSSSLQQSHLDSGSGSGGHSYSHSLNKRRKTILNSDNSMTVIASAGSTSVSSNEHHHSSRGRGHQLHSIHSHEASGGESADGSRPGTPLCDERPENLPPSEPRRIPTSRSYNQEPLSLPLPRFAIQFLQQYRLQQQQSSSASSSSTASSSSATSALPSSTTSTLFPSATVSSSASTALSSSLHSASAAAVIAASSGALPAALSSNSSLLHNTLSSPPPTHSSKLSLLIPPSVGVAAGSGSGSSTTTGNTPASASTTNILEHGSNQAPASPLRPPSISSNSSDSESGPSTSPSLEERINKLDEMYEKWSGNSQTRLNNAGNEHHFNNDRHHIQPAQPLPQLQLQHVYAGHNHIGSGNNNTGSLNQSPISNVSSSSTSSFRHKFLELDVKEVPPSDIVKSLLSRKSIFDEDLKRLENIGDKYEPGVLVNFPKNPVTTTLNTVAIASTTNPTVVSPVVNTAILASQSPLHALKAQTPPAPSLQRIGSCSTSGSPMNSPQPYNSPNPSVKSGLQYPFPSHPPSMPSVATAAAAAVTTATSLAPAPTVTSSSTPLSVAGSTNIGTIVTSTSTSSSDTVTTAAAAATASCSSAPLANKPKTNVLNKSISLTEKASTNICSNNNNNLTNSSNNLTSTSGSNHTSINESVKLPVLNESTGTTATTTSIATPKVSISSTSSSSSSTTTTTTPPAEPASVVVSAPSAVASASSAKHTATITTAAAAAAPLGSTNCGTIKLTSQLAPDNSTSSDRANQHSNSSSTSSNHEHEKHDKPSSNGSKSHHKDRRKLSTASSCSTSSTGSVTPPAPATTTTGPTVAPPPPPAEAKPSSEPSTSEQQQVPPPKHNKINKVNHHGHGHRHSCDSTSSSSSSSSSATHKAGHHSRNATDNSSSTDFDRLKQDVRPNAVANCRSASVEKREQEPRKTSTSSSSEGKPEEEPKRKVEETPAKEPEVSKPKEPEEPEHQATQNHCEDMEIGEQQQDKQCDKEEPLDDGQHKERRDRVSSVGSNSSVRNSSKRRHNSHDSNDSPTEDSHAQKKHKQNNLDSSRIFERRDSGKDGKKEKHHKSHNRSEKSSKCSSVSSSSSEKSVSHLNALAKHDNHDEKQQFLLDERRKEITFSNEGQLQQHSHHQKKKERYHDKHKSKKDHESCRDKENTQSVNFPQESFAGNRSTSDEEDQTRTHHKADRKCPKDYAPKRYHSESGGDTKKYDRKLSRAESSADEEGRKKKNRPNHTRAKTANNSSDTDDSDEPKKHSIFDIPDDPMPNISMYDKVKARSCKNMQKQEEEKKIKEKFSKLKQCRAKREGKNRSKSWDDDSDSDANSDTTINSKYNHKDQLNKSGMITTSDDDDQMPSTPRFRRHNKEHLASDSEDENHRIRFNRDRLNNLCDDESSDGDRPKKENMPHTPRRSSSEKKMSRKNSRSTRIQSDSDSENEGTIDQAKAANENQDSECDKPKQAVQDAEKAQSAIPKIEPPSIKQEIKCEEDAPAEETKKVEIKVETKVQPPSALVTSDVSDDETVKPAVVKSEFIPSTMIKKEPIDDGYSYSKERLNQLCDASSEGEPNMTPVVASAEIDNTVNSAVDQLMYGHPEATKRKHKKKQKRHKTNDGSEGENKPEKEHSPTSDGLAGSTFDNLKKTADDQLYVSSKKKHSGKKEKRRERCKEDYDKPGKSKKSKNKHKENNNKVPEIPSPNTKREEKMEDIFGPISDDESQHSSVETEVSVKQEPVDADTEAKPAEEESKQVDDRPNDSEVSEKDKLKEESRKRKERKRREREKLRTTMTMKEEENSVDLDEAGRALEAQLMSDSDQKAEDASPTSTVGTSGKRSSVDVMDVFRFTDGDDSMENSFSEKKESDHGRKEKKKKKKRGKDEKHKHHHGSSNNIPPTTTPISPTTSKLSLDIISAQQDDSKNSIGKPSPSLPCLLDESPPSSNLHHASTAATGPMSPPTPTGREMACSTPTNLEEATLTKEENLSAREVESCSKQAKQQRKPDKLIPGFGTDMDEQIHEKAVLSISGDFINEKIASDDRKPTDIVDPLKHKADDMKIEEKSRVVISQEETEDAVAALLGESFGTSNTPDFSIDYSIDPVEESSSQLVADTPQIPEEDDEEMKNAILSLNTEEHIKLDIKPDTPQSEHDLQIDTDTDDQAEDEHPASLLRFDNPPKTPDVDLSQIGKPLSESITSSSAPDSVKKEDKLEMPDTPGKNVSTVSSASTTTPIQSPIATSSVISKVTTSTESGTIASTASCTVPTTTCTKPTVAPVQAPIIAQPPVIPPATTIAMIPESPAKIVSTATVVTASKPMTVFTSTPSPMQVKPTPVDTQKTPVVSSQPATAPPVVRNPYVMLAPPTINIPEQHVVYQPSDAVSMSPRGSNGADLRMQSPKLQQIQSSIPFTKATSPTSPNLLRPQQIIANRQSPQHSPGLNSHPTILHPASGGHMLVSSPTSSGQFAPKPNHIVQPRFPVVTASPMKINVPQQKPLEQQPVLLKQQQQQPVTNISPVVQMARVATTMANTSMPMMETPGPTVTVSTAPMPTKGMDVTQKTTLPGTPSKTIIHQTPVYIQHPPSKPMVTAVQSPVRLQPTHPSIVVAKPLVVESKPLNTISTITSNPNHNVQSEMPVESKSDGKELLASTETQRNQPEATTTQKSAPTTTGSTDASGKKSAADSLLTEENVSKIPNSSNATSSVLGIDQEDQEGDSKEDSDYWSSKDTIIDSVIKKVDALCSEDDASEGGLELNREEWNKQESETLKTSTANPVTSMPPVPESAKVEVVQAPALPEPPVVPAASPIALIQPPSQPQMQSVVQRTPPTPPAPAMHVEEAEDHEETVTTAVECPIPETSTRGGKRGGRRGGRKTSESLTTPVKMPELPEATTTPAKRGAKAGAKRGRGGGRGGARGGAANVQPTPGVGGYKGKNFNSGSDVYEFHDDSGEEVQSADKQLQDGGRPRLILTIKNQVTTAAPMPTTSTVPVAVTAAPLAPLNVTNVTTINTSTAQLQPTTSCPAPLLPVDPHNNPAPAVDGSKDDFVHPSSNTRKSRRLLEKDGRTTVDDIIDDVIRNGPSSVEPPTPPMQQQPPPMPTPLVGGFGQFQPQPVSVPTSQPGNQPLPQQQIQTQLQPLPVAADHTGRRATRQNVTPVTGAGTDARKSPRAGRKGKNRTISESSSVDSSDEKPVGLAARPNLGDVKTEEKTQTATTPITPTLPVTRPNETASLADKSKEKPKSAEDFKMEFGNSQALGPLTLIDPVTGELTVMRTGKEGQYVPLPNANAPQPLKKVIAAAAQSAEQMKTNASSPTPPISASASPVQHRTPTPGSVPSPGMTRVPTPNAYPVQQQQQQLEVQKMNKQSSPLPLTLQNQMNPTASAVVVPSPHSNTGTMVIQHSQGPPQAQQPVGVMQQQQGPPSSKPHPLKQHVLNAQQIMSQQQPPNAGKHIQQQQQHPVGNQQQHQQQIIFKSAIPMTSQTPSSGAIHTTTGKQIHPSSNIKMAPQIIQQGGPPPQHTQQIIIQNAMSQQSMTINKHTTTIINKQGQPQGHHQPGSGNLLINIPQNMQQQMGNVPMSPRMQQQQQQQHHQVVITNSKPGPMSNQQQQQQQQQHSPHIIHKLPAGQSQPQPQQIIIQGGKIPPGHHQIPMGYTTVVQSGTKIIHQSTLQPGQGQPGGPQQQPMPGKHATQTIQIGQFHGTQTSQSPTTVVQKTITTSHGGQQQHIRIQQQKIGGPEALSHLQPVHMIGKQQLIQPPMGTAVGGKMLPQQPSQMHQPVGLTKLNHVGPVGNQQQQQQPQQLTIQQQQGKGGMPSHLHQQPPQGIPGQIMTGAVASPPLKHMHSQQPVGASSSRVAHPAISPQGMPPGPQQQPPPGSSSTMRHVQGPGLNVPPQVAYEANPHGDLVGFIGRGQSPPPAHQQQTSPITPTDAAFRSGMPRDYVKYIYARNTIHMPSRSPLLPGSVEQRELSEMEDSVAASPPLELRRPSSGPRPSTSVPPSLQSPGERSTDSPQVAQVYIGSARIPHTYSDSLNTRFYDPAASGPNAPPRALSTEPPPAHHRPHNLSTSGGSGFPPGSSYPGTPSQTPPPASPANLSQLQPQQQQQQQQQQRDRDLLQQRDRVTMPGHAAAATVGAGAIPIQASPLPAHSGGIPGVIPNTGRNAVVPPISVASGSSSTGGNTGTLVPSGQQQPTAVPSQSDSLDQLLQRYPVMWQGLLALKNDQAAVQMHFVHGNPGVAGSSLPSNSDGTTPPLRIAQRMRLEPAQIDGVARKMQMDQEHCMLLALPCGRDRMDVLQQQNNLQTGFITYLQQKQAAGIVNIAAPGSSQAAYVVHIFPSCEFANENLARIAPDLMHRVANIQYLLIVIATV